MWYLGHTTLVADNVMYNSQHGLLMIYVVSFQQGHRQDMLNDMFWLMAFLKSACFIGSQAIANWLVGNSFKQHIGSLSTATVLLAILSIIPITRGRKEPAKLAASKDYQASFYTFVLCGIICIVAKIS